MRAVSFVLNVLIAVSVGCAFTFFVMPHALVFVMCGEDRWGGCGDSGALFAAYIGGGVVAILTLIYLMRLRRGDMWR